MKYIQTFSSLIWAKKDNKKKNQASLFARVTVDGKRVEIALKKRLS